MKGLFTLAVAMAVVVGVVLVGSAESFQLPGVIPPSGCRVGGVLSTEQWTSTGFSNVRTANPNDEVVSGAWVVVNNFVRDTSIILAPNCAAAPFGGIGSRFDGLGLNLMGVRLKPTFASAAEADIREVKLVWDVNANGLWDPLLDLVLQTKPGELLDTQDGAVFFNGPQSPLAFLASLVPGVDGGICFMNVPTAAPLLGVGPAVGTNSRGVPPRDGCWIALLAIAVIGENPMTGSQFGLQLEAFAGDIPSSTGTSSFTFSSGFSSSRNPQASNVRVHMIGGSPSSHTPLENISNGNGSPESAVRALTFTGGQQGEGLLSRFRALEIVPGMREAIAMAVGVCDGAELANTIAAVLPPIAGAPPTIAGGLASLPCIPSAGTDGYATGINGATLIFRGPLARYMGTVRLYTDECSVFGSTLAPAGAGVCIVAGANAAPTTATVQGGGDGFLFQAGEITEQVVPKFNEQTGEAIAQFGGRQEQVLYTGNGSVVGDGSDPATPAIGGIRVGTRPLILIWTVDIDQAAPGGVVDVLMGLQSYDDTAMFSGLIPKANPCLIFRATAPAFSVSVGTIPGKKGLGGFCASNFLNTGPETYSFTIEAPQHPSTPSSLSALDTNKSCFLDDPEFFAMIDGWVAARIGDSLFFQGVDSWVGQSNICGATASHISGLSLINVWLASSGLGTTTFMVHGQGIAGTQVEVFSLDGRVLFKQSAAGSHLMWNQLTTTGAPLANGTYLYVVTVEGAEGQTIKSEVKKLMVLR